MQASDVNKWVRPITSDRFNEPISVTEANTGLKGANKDADKGKGLLAWINNKFKNKKQPNQTNQDDNKRFRLSYEYLGKHYPTVRMMIEGIICEAIC